MNGIHDPTPASAAPMTVYGLFRHRPPLPTDLGAGTVKVIFEMVRELTKDQFDQAGEAVQVIGRVLVGFDNNLERSFNGLTESTERLTAAFGNSDAFQDFSNWGPDLLHHITNFSVALVMHQTYVTSEVGHLYGRDNAQHIAVKKAFSDLYDRSLSYRIIYGFRNAIVHSSRPLVSSYANSKLVIDLNGNEHIESDVKLRLIREAFSTTKPNAKLRDEVLALTEDPELLEACRAAWAETKAVHAGIAPVLYPTRNEAVQTLWEYVVETAALGGYGPYFNSLQKPDPSVGMQMVPVSHSIINYVWKSGMAEGLRPPYVMVPGPAL